MLIRFCQGLSGCDHRSSVSSWGVCVAVDREALPGACSKPILYAENWVQVKGQAGVDPLRLDVDCIEQIRLPSSIKAVKRHDWQLKGAIQFAKPLKCQEPMLPIYDLQGSDVGASNPHRQNHQVAARWLGCRLYAVCQSRLC